MNASWQTNTQIYDVGFVLIEYIVETWGKEQLASLIKTYGDIRSVLGISVATFENNWHEFVRTKYL